jgi:hypothetical protein
MEVLKRHSEYPPSFRHYSAYNFWVFQLFQLSGILETRKHDVSEIGSVSVLM